MPPNPAVRLTRLRRDHEVMLELAESSRLISWEAVGDPPEQYRVTYDCIGAVRQGKRVRFLKGHQVGIKLHAQYPFKAPALKLLTPVFHPNFRFGNPQLSICIEAQMWRPSEALDDLVIRIGNMITYRNYDPDNPLDAVAASWSRRSSERFPLDSRPWISGDDAVMMLDRDEE